MIILDATTRSLEIDLAGAVSTTQLPVVTSYVDVTTTTYTPGSDNTATNDTTAVTIVAAPGASTQRQVKLITVYNADTASATVTIQYNDNSTLRTIIKCALASGYTLVYTDGEGFRVINSSGSIQSGATGSGEANTASNQGVGGVGLFYQKTGVDLEFKNVNAGSDFITIANDSTNIEVDVDVATDLKLMDGAESVQPWERVIAGSNITITELADGEAIEIASSGGGVTDHGALTGLDPDDDHTQYLLASAATDRATFAANWTDLTDGGATTLHSHAGAGGDTTPDLLTHVDGETQTEIWERLLEGRNVSFDISSSGQSVAINALPNVIIKTADETINSDTTMSNDSELTVSLTQGEWLAICILCYESVTAADIQFDFAFTGTITNSRCMYFGLDEGATSSTGSLKTAAPSMGVPRPFAGVGAGLFANVIAACWLSAGTAGTFSLQWAQNASSASDTKVKRGSFMLLIRQS